jgi:hypothetical protein
MHDKTRPDRRILNYLYPRLPRAAAAEQRAGEPTGALFGVVNMLRGHLKEKPDYIAFVMDAPGQDLPRRPVSDYKANRAADAGRAARAGRADDGDRRRRWACPMLRVDGVEADDVIGTLAVQRRRSRHRRHHLHRRQGHRAAGAAARGAGQHHERQPARFRRSGDGEIRRARRPDRRLPGADGRQRRQHPRRPESAGRRPRRSGWPNTARWMA